MNDPHLNIFHSYRGPSASEGTATRQLEDNLTRALIITLEKIRQSAARVEMLRSLRIPVTNLNEPYQCRLQVSKEDPDWPRSSKRRLLVIHGGPTLNVTREHDATMTGRVDAIIASNDFVLAIESKLGNQVSEGQLDRHRATLGITSAGTDDITWTDVFRAARHARLSTKHEPIVHFVLKQFEEYLHMNGFGGLTEEHLSYFALRQESRDDLVKDGIRRALTELITTLAKIWGTDWNVHRPGNIMNGGRDAFVKLAPGREGQSPHLSVVIGPAGLDIFENGETERPFSRFRKALKQDEYGLIEVLRSLGTDWPQQVATTPTWRLSVVRRIPNRPRFDHYHPALDIVIATLVGWDDAHISWFLESVTEKPEGEHAPEIKLIRTYPADLIINNDDLPAQLAADASQLEPFFDWLGEPVR